MPSIRDLFDNGSNDGKLGWGINARNAVLLLAALLLIRQVSVTIYNLHVHPLRGIPGPQLWIAFPFLRRYLMIRGTGEAKIRELHDRYGEVVRVEANEVYFLNPQAWKDIYGHGHAEFPKHEPEGLKMDPRKIVVANAKDHFRLRRAMLPAFSEKALSQQEPLIRAYVDLLIQRLQAVSDPVNSINIVRWYNLATFDLIADLAFGESLQGLRTGRSNAWIDSIVQMFAIWPMFEAVGALGHVGSLIVLLLSPLIRHGERRHTANAAKMANGRLNARKQPDRGDFMDYFLRSRGQAHSLSDDEIIANSGLLMVAGSETSASLLSGLTYWLLKTPDALRRVTREVREAFGSEEEMTFVETRARLPYLSACMEEGLRMYPPVPFATLRRVPENTPMEVCGIMLPPKTRVGVHHLAACTSKINFHRPLEFCPERWLPDAMTNPASPFYNDCREVHKPFSFGPRDCIGRGLAYHEIRLIMAKVLFHFDMRLDPSCDQWYNQRIYGLWEKPPLKVYLTKREKA